MFELIKYDLKRNKMIILAFSLIAIYFLAVNMNYWLYALCWMSILPFFPLSREEKDNGYEFLISLPVKKENIVASKYICAWLITAYISFVFFLLPKILETLPYLKFTGTEGLINVSTIVLGFAIISFNICVLFPLFFRFHSSKIIIIFIILSSMFCGLVFSLQKYSAKPGDFFYGYCRFREGIETTALAVNGSVGIFGLLFVFACIIYCISYISCKISVEMLKRRGQPLFYNLRLKHNKLLAN